MLSPLTYSQFNSSRRRQIKDLADGLQVHAAAFGNIADFQAHDRFPPFIISGYTLYLAIGSSSFFSLIYAGSEVEAILSAPRQPCHRVFLMRVYACGESP
jgi:hypothetical protein